MRVIAGEARSLPLKAPEGIDTRPTTDRIKAVSYTHLDVYKRQPDSSGIPYGGNATHGTGNPWDNPQ